MKKTLLKISLVFILISTFIPSNSIKAQQNRIPVVPYPQEVSLKKGFYSPVGSSVSIRISGIEAKNEAIIISQLSKAFSDKYGIEVKVNKDANPDIWIGMPDSDIQLKELAKKNKILPDNELGDEGYILNIERKNIVILANSQAGAFYGVQSLKQLLRGYDNTQDLPSLNIRDWPSIAFRCVMDDISRGPIPTKEFIKNQIHRYSEMKINNMSFYIEHVVKTKKYPDFAPDNGGISIEEFAELSEYAADYHIELVGNFQSLGHFEKILSLPQYRHLGATERMLDPLNPESVEFLRDVYKEMAPAFSSIYFTPNLDEAWDLTRGKLSTAVDSLSAAQIYVNHVLRIDSTLTNLGKKTIVWGDIILEHKEILDMIPKSIILGAWDYSASESFSEFIDPLKDAGFDFTVTPGVLNSGRLIPDFRMTTINIRNFINEGYEKGTLGVYCTIWDDGGMHFFSHDWYGVAYNAEQSWRPNRESLEDFDIRFSRGIYGDQKNLIPETINTLNKLTDLEPTFEMNSNILWKTLIPERGEKVTFNPDSWVEVKKWAQMASELLDSESTIHYDSDLDFIRFTASEYEFMADCRNNLLLAADAYNRACALQNTDRIACLVLLKETQNLLGLQKHLYEKIMIEFGRLWDLENRLYWRDRGLLDYEKRMEAFNDQGRLLDMAIENFKSGGYLPAPTEVRLDIRQQGGQYFQFWLLSGSFHIETYEEHTTDFLVPMGGEALARPFPGMNFTDEEGIERSWIKYDSPKLGEVDFKSIFEPHITTVAYAYCIIESPEKKKVTALLGSNDGATVFCNGEKVFYFHGKRSLIPDENEIVLNLEKGKNHILIKVEQWKAGWGFSFRLKDEDIRNHKQKYYIQ